MNSSDVLIETLINWGVEYIFGLPGDGINGIIEALRVRQDKIKFIQVRHEESAAFMACGYAKVTGKLGVCLATSGPGAIHLLNGLYDAKLDGAPVLAITGMQFHDLIGTMTQQDIETDKLFIDVAQYNQRIMGSAHVENVVELACRTALSYRCVSHVTIPVDLQEMEVKKDERSKRNVPHHVSNMLSNSAREPRLDDIMRAAEVLNAGKKVVVLAGQGALHATDELEQIAEILGAPIVKALLGKAAVPDHSPYTTGSIGLLGTRPSQDAMESCDTLLMVGSSFPYIEFLPKPDQARGVQIDANPTRISLRYPMEVGIVGDSKKSLQALIPHLKRKDDRGFLKKAQDGMREWFEFMDKLGTSRETPMKPQVVAHELGQRLADDAIVLCDSGTIATWWARHIPARRGQIHTLSGNLATMAPGLPYALAAQIAYPGRQVVAFVGDGGFSMLMADFVTAVKYRLPIKVVIIDNHYLGQIKWEQMVFLGNPEFGVDLQPIDFAAFAHACGGVGYRCDNPADIGSMMEQFLAAPGPAILDAIVDPNTAPMPGKISAEQAFKFAESIARGEPKGLDIVRTALKDRARELI
jgi:pyruvate dehydrogenase (quinone)/pyruvate oxidase